MLPAGRKASLKYGFNQWESRLVLDHVQGSEHMVASPDFDIFAEQLEGSLTKAAAKEGSSRKEFYEQIRRDLGVRQTGRRFEGVAQVQHHRPRQAWGALC